jgi:oxygen-independent coproporphyrinogen-3 oxidase
MTLRPFGLYVHVPWCRHVCPYCDFNVHAATRVPASEFAAAIARELAAHVSGPPWAGRPIATLYLGGGTPSLLAPPAVAAIVEAARRAGLAADAEVTLEANPGTVSLDSLVGHRAAGVTRLSLGAQSFDARLLRTLGRDHGPDDTRAAVGAARAAGLENVSLDLIYAVPGETVADCDTDLEALLALDPPHVSAYALTWEDGTPFAAWRASGRLRPVSDDDEAEMAARLVRRLEAAGLARYEISSFARPGFESRHNGRYWDGSDYLGLGPGAHSFAATPFPGRRTVNERLPARWMDAVAGRATAVASEEALTEAQARGEFCFAGLRRLAGVDLAAFERRFDVALATAFPEVERLTADGLVERAGGRLRLTPRGLLFADAVAATFV